MKALKKEMKEKQEAEIWKKIFRCENGEESGLQSWKKNYLYPFGNIAPIKDHDLSTHGDAATIQSLPSARNLN